MQSDHALHCWGNNSFSSYGPTTFSNNYVVISSANIGCCFISSGNNIYYSILNTRSQSIITPYGLGEE
jgi:hypothetical protein